MKKIIFSALALFLVGQVFALNITDPFYMPKKEGFFLDSTLAFENSGPTRAYGIKETFYYGIMDNLSLGVDLGWAKIKDGDNGLQDPNIYARYRLIHEEDSRDGLVVDLKGYISPSIFNSPANGKKGVAKGSTNFGFSVLGGSREWLANTLLYLEVSLQSIGSTDYTKSGTIIGISGNGKYYLDDLNSFGAGVFTKMYSGFGNSYTGYGIRLDYARVLQDNLALVPFWSAEAHSDHIPSEVNYGITLRYTF
ncbi:MAG: hypothetical protein II972_03660 [Elusimicrobiaceae bacterium]|nr:hypothetical protein [Elusimicrobiaceae bacterium]MBQ6224175.1 hypothetical protein [Campylobacter sp.]